MNNFLLFVGGVLVLLLGAAFIAPQYIDWNEYRAAFEDEASRVIGRPIRVGGNVDLRLLPSPYIRFERLRIADQNGRFSAPFFKADGIRLWLSVAPMLRGVIEARHVELTKPRLRLAFDRQGRGNWQMANRPQDTSGLSPAKIALQSVSMTDGSVVVVKSDGSELVRLTAIQGEFSANSVEGPYNFDGNFLGAGRKRRIRFSSGRMQQDNSLKFRTVMSSGSGARAMRFSFDGKLTDFFGALKLDGKIAAKRSLALAAATTDGVSGQAPKQSKSPVFDLKGKLQASALGLAMTDLSLAFEQAGRPQLLSGTISMSWNKEFVTRSAFRSRWLDIDRIAAGGLDVSPMRSVLQMINQLDNTFAGAQSSRASLSIDQANLGGEVVSDIVIGLSHSDERTMLETFSAKLPGQASVQAKGRLVGVAGARRFDGEAALHGGNLQRFAKWIAPTLQSAVKLDAGSFSMRGRVNAGADWASVSDLSAEVGNTILTGSVKYSQRGASSVAIDLEAPRLDASRWLPSGLRLANLLQLIKEPWDFALRKPGAAQGQLAKAADNNATGRKQRTGDKTIKFQIGRLRVGDELYSDVALDASLQNGALTLQMLRLNAGKDLSLDLSGKVSGLYGMPSGAIKGVAKALTGKTVAALEQMLDIPAGLQLQPSRSASLAPLRLAGRLEFGDGQVGVAANASQSQQQSAQVAAVEPANKRRASLSLSGSVAGGRVEVWASFDRGLKDWRNGLAEAELMLSNPQSTVLVKQLLPQNNGYRPAADSQGVFRLNVVGVPARGLTTAFTLKAESLSGNFKGRLGLAKPAASGPRFDRLVGEVNINLSQAAPLLSALGLDGAALGSDAVASGKMRVVADAKSIAVDHLQLAVNVKQLLPQNNGYRPAADSQGVFRLNVVGVPARGLTTAFTLKAESLSGNFKGRLGLAKPAASGPRFDRLVGEVNINLSQAAPLLSALGLDGAALGSDAVASGKMRVVADAKSIAVDHLQLAVNGTGLTGHAQIVKLSDRPLQLSAKLTASRLSATALMAPALARAPANTVSRLVGLETAVSQNLAAGGSGQENIWPMAPFDFRALRNLEGSVNLKAENLTLAPGLLLSDAQIDIDLSKGKIALRSLAGKALGGRLSGVIELEEAPAGAKLRGALKFEAVQLSRLLASPGEQPAQGRSVRSVRPVQSVEAQPSLGQMVKGQMASLPVVSGNASLSLSFYGQALSPKGLVSALRGGGAVAVGPAKLRAMNPLAINGSADAILDTKPNNPSEAIHRELVQRLASGIFKLGPRQIKLTIADGALRVQRFSIRTQAGTITTTNTVDLLNLKLDSEWHIKPDAQVSNVTGKPMTALPAVTLTYVGPLGRLGALVPRIDAAALVRELTVREMERDVEKLEQLRRRDEARARQEAARRQAIEVERARQRALIEAERLRKERAATPDTGPGNRGAPSFQNEYQRQGQAEGSGGLGIDPDFATGGARLPSRGRAAAIRPAAGPDSGEAAAVAGIDRIGRATAAAPAPPAPALGEAVVPAPRPVPRPRRAVKRRKKWNPFAEQF